MKSIFKMRVKFKKNHISLGLYWHSLISSCSERGNNYWLIDCTYGSLRVRRLLVTSGSVYNIPKPGMTDLSMSPHCIKLKLSLRQAFRYREHLEVPNDTGRCKAGLLCKSIHNILRIKLLKLTHHKYSCTRTKPVAGASLNTQHVMLAKHFFLLELENENSNCHLFILTIKKEKYRWVKRIMFRNWNQLLHCDIF